MAGYRKKNADGPNSEDKALDLFAEMMIEKIEGIQKDWKKPWFTEGALQWPRNPVSYTHLVRQRTERIYGLPQGGCNGTDG